MKQVSDFHDEANKAERGCERQLWMAAPQNGDSRVNSCFGPKELTRGDGTQTTSRGDRAYRFRIMGHIRDHEAEMTNANLQHRKARGIAPVGVALALISAYGLGLASAEAQERFVRSTHASWNVECVTFQNVDTCGAQQFAGLEHSGAVELTLSELNAATVLSLQTPHFSDLSKGLTLAVDGGTALELEYLTSNKEGTYTELALTPQLLAALRGGTTASVGYSTFISQRGWVTIPVALDGLAAALDAR